MLVTCVFENGEHHVVEPGEDATVTDLKSLAAAAAWGDAGVSQCLTVYLDGDVHCSDTDALADIQLEDGGTVAIRNAFCDIPGPAAYALGGAAECLCVSPCGRWVAVALGNCIDVWDVQGGVREESINTYSISTFDSMCFSPCGTQVVTLEDDHMEFHVSIRIYSRESGSLVESFGSDRQLVGVGVSSCGTKVVTSAYLCPSVVQVRDRGSGVIVYESDAFRHCVALPGGFMLACGSDGSALVSLDSLRPVRSFPLRAAQMLSACSTVAAAVLSGTVLETWCLNTGELLKACDTSIHFYELCVSPCGRWVVTVDRCSVTAWSARTLEPTVLATGLGTLQGLGVSPCSRWVYVSGSGHVLHVLAMCPAPLPEGA